MTLSRLSIYARQEWFLAVSLLSCLAFFADGASLRADFAQPLRLIAIFIWLFAVVLGSAFAVVRHAEALAELIGEPYGTLILTLSVTSIEVMSITAVMMHGDNNPTLARDTLFAVTMIILNGMVGLSLLLGAWRHREQQYNLQGANAYLGVIIPLAVLSLVMPSLTVESQGPDLSFGQQIFLVGVSVGLYAAFLALQINRHRGYFVLHPEPRAAPPVAECANRYGVPFHALLLIAYIAPVVFLSEQFAHPVDYLIETLHVPTAVAGVVMAILVATPEAIGAVRAALANQLQRSVNIFLGSVLSTIGLTVPAIVIISGMTGQGIELGLQPTDLMMLLLTLTVSVVTFASGRTNILQGVVHLVLFVAYLFLIVQR
jgi:Ca2+:H+ antiporter